MTVPYKLAPCPWCKGNGSKRKYYTLDNASRNEINPKWETVPCLECNGKRIIQYKPLDEKEGVPWVLK